MGGYGSTRWGMTVTRATTDGLPRLDVRALARAGLLRPGATATVSWGPGATVRIAVDVGTPDQVMLTYHTGMEGASRFPVVESLTLIRTACTFGGTRPWLVCPGCHSRRAVLYACVGRFRCRVCHDLTYASTRACT